MYRKTAYRIALIAGGFFAVWLFFRFLLPLALPFGLGLLLALAAEPAVQLGTRLRLPRWASAGVGVSLTLLLLLVLVGILGAAIVKELGMLAGRLPDLQATATATADRVRLYLESAADRAPEGVRPLMTGAVKRLFSSGTALMEQATVGLPGAISAFLSRVPDGALGIGTGILSAFMLSARLPRLKTLLGERLPDGIKTKLLPPLQRAKTALWGWLKAQLKLSGITFCVVITGFLLLRIPYAPLWAGAVAVVDAVPLLGTGIVLLPWALICLLRRQHLLSVGLLLTYAAAFLTRTVLEPRLVGRHLGLDPLATLVCLYLGYRFWGVGGMLLAPMLAAAVMAAARIEN